jgi:hypothetical protein
MIISQVKLINMMMFASYSSQYYEVDNSMFKHSEQAITHVRGCHGDSNQ